MYTINKPNFSIVAVDSRLKDHGNDTFFKPGQQPMPDIQNTVSLNIIMHDRVF